MKILIYISTVVLLYSCISGRSYNRPSKLVKLNKPIGKATKIKIENEDFFQLRVFEEKIYYSEDSFYSDTEYLNYTQSVDFQNDDTEVTRQVAEETYLYLQDISKSKYNTNIKTKGKAIYMESYPIIRLPSDINSYRNYYFDNKDTIFSNIIKTCYVGEWQLINNSYLVSFTKSTGLSKKNKIKFQLTGKYVKSKSKGESKGFVSFHEITHPSKAKSSGSEIDTLNLNSIKMDHIIQLAKIPEKVLESNYYDEPEMEQGLLFFNVPLKKKIVISEDVMISKKMDKSKYSDEVNSFLIENDRLIFQTKSASFSHTNTEMPVAKGSTK